MAPQPYPADDPIAQRTWFFSPRNQDFGIFIRASAQLRTTFQDLIVQVVGLSDLEDLQAICDKEIYDTDLWRSGTGQVTQAEKTELVNAVLKEIDDVCGEVERADGYDMWLKKAMMVYLGLEIRKARAKDLHCTKTSLTAPAPLQKSGNETVSSIPLDPTSHKNLSSSTKGGTFGPYPHRGTDSQKADWFEDPKNQNFAPFAKLKQRSLRSDWEPLLNVIVDVTGLENSREFEELCKVVFSKTKVLHGDKLSITATKRAELVEAIIQSITERHEASRPHGFQKWIHNAVSVYIPREIVREKDRVRRLIRGERRDEESASEAKRVKLDHRALPQHHPKYSDDANNKSSEIKRLIDIKPFPEHAAKKHILTWLKTFNVSTIDEYQPGDERKLRDLIAKVVCFELPSDLDDLMKEKIIDGNFQNLKGWEKREAKERLIRETFDDIKLHCNQRQLNNYEVYTNWMVAALRAYFPFILKSLSQMKNNAELPPDSPGLFVEENTPVKTTIIGSEICLIELDDSEEDESQQHIEDLKSMTRKKQMARQHGRGQDNSKLVTPPAEAASVHVASLKNHLQESPHRQDEKDAEYCQANRQVQEQSLRMSQLAQAQHELEAQVQARVQPNSTSKPAPVPQFNEHGPKLQQEESDKSSPTGYAHFLQPLKALLTPELEMSQTFHPATDLYGVTHAEVKLYGNIPMPHTITTLKPLDAVKFANTPGGPGEEFDFVFLRNEFKGTALSNGQYSFSADPTSNNEYYDMTSYRLLTPEFEPLLPRLLGEHGAQISFLASGTKTADTSRFPLFIKYKTGYRYFGHYRQAHKPDALSRNEMLQLPQAIKRHWAELLCKQPVSTKLVPVIDSTLSKPKNFVTKDPNTGEDHVDWTHHERDGEQSEIDQFGEYCLTGGSNPRWVEAVMKSFEQTDLGTNTPPLRLYYEYLECVEYHTAFYCHLVGRKCAVQLEALEDEHFF